MIVPVNLSEMSQQAEKIFVGRCSEGEIGLDEHRIPVTYLRFEVSEGIKGVDSGETFLVKFFGTQKEPLFVKEGESAVVPFRKALFMPTAFEAGEEYLLFLYPESSLGFTSAVGGGQGRFQIISNDGVSTLAVNPLNNRYLEYAGIGDEGPVDLNKILSAVKKLVADE